MRLRLICCAVAVVEVQRQRQRRQAETRPIQASTLKTPPLQILHQHHPPWTPIAATYASH